MAALLGLSLTDPVAGALALVGELPSSPPLLEVPEVPTVTTAPPPQEQEVGSVYWVNADQTQGEEPESQTVSQASPMDLAGTQTIDQASEPDDPFALLLDDFWGSPRSQAQPQTTSGANETAAPSSGSKGDGSGSAASTISYPPLKEGTAETAGGPARTRGEVVPPSFLASLGESGNGSGEQLSALLDSGGSGGAIIGALVWEDLDADGILDTTEPGRSGVTVRLLSEWGEHASAGTDSNG